MKKFCVMMAAVVVLMSGIGSLALAQEADTHAQAAEQFLLAMQTPEQLEEGIASMVDLMLQAQPMMAPYRTTIQGFYTKYLSWDALKDDYIGITVDLLSESDLSELTSFFKTSVGQKFIEKQPEMFQRTSELGFQVMQDHQQELMDLLEAEASKYAAPGGAEGAE